MDPVAFRMQNLIESGEEMAAGDAQRLLHDERAQLEIGLDELPRALEPAVRDRLVQELTALGYRHVGWDVELYEWEPGRTAHEIADRVQRVADVFS